MMSIFRIRWHIVLVFVAVLLLLSACGKQDDGVQEPVLQEEQHDISEDSTPEPPVQEPDKKEEEAEPPVEDEPDTVVTEGEQSDTPEPPAAIEDLYNEEAVEVVADPEAIAVLINKRYALPKEYKPADLTEPNVPFIFKEKSDKRLLRKEAAEALERLFAAAEEDGIRLAGVSGYRSYAYQKGLFERYVKRDGLEAASRYSARPGHSEHSTGLAMDVSGINGKCAATDCFADTEEAKWLAEHVYDYGFIIRYPQGKEEITGYKYEPWHLRYVGVDVAAEIKEQGITLEEYYEQQDQGEDSQPETV